MIYKIKDCYPRRRLLIFYNSYAKTAKTYGLLAYRATKKTIFQPIENEPWRIFRAVFHKKPVDSLQEIMANHHLQTIHQFFLSQIVSELFRQTRRNSPFNFLGTILIPKEVINRRREKGLLPNQSSRTKLRQRFLKISILKLYDWLHSSNLIPYDLKNFNRYQVKSYLNLLNHNNVRCNQDLFHSFYWNSSHLSIGQFFRKLVKKRFQNIDTYQLLATGCFSGRGLWRDAQLLPRPFW